MFIVSFVSNAAQLSSENATKHDTNSSHGYVVFRRLSSRCCFVLRLRLAESLNMPSALTNQSVVFSCLTEEADVLVRFDDSAVCRPLIGQLGLILHYHWLLLTHNNRRHTSNSSCHTKLRSTNAGLMTFQ